MKLHLINIFLFLAFLSGTIPASAQENPRGFYTAIYKGDLNTVKHYVNNGTDVNTAHNNWSPLIVAARHGHAEVFNFLLSRGADALAVDKNGKSILMWASESGCVEIVQTLLSRKVSVDLCDKNGNTALIWTCAWKKDIVSEIAEEQQGKIAAQLLAAGSEVDARNMQGETPLLLASKYGSTACVRVVLNTNAQVNVADNEGRTALLMACDYGYSEVAQILVAHRADVNIAAARGQTPLMLAAENGDARSVRLLLSNGADVQRKDKKGRSARDYAIAVNVGDLLHAAGVHFPKSQQTAGEMDAEATNTVDYALYDLLLADLRRGGEFSPWDGSQENGGAGPRVVTETRMFQTYELENMKWDIERGGLNGQKALADVLEDVKRRNRRVVVLHEYQPKFEAHTIRPKQHVSDKAIFKCILSFAVPGYSSDGNTAYVFFWFADGGMHGGGTGIYCLQKQGEFWQVAWKNIGFYM